MNEKKCQLCSKTQMSDGSLCDICKANLAEGLMSNLEDPIMKWVNGEIDYVEKEMLIHA